MDSNIFQNNYDKLKTNLILDIQADMSKLNEKVDFSSIMYQVDPKDSDRLFSLYGVDNKMILVDSALIGTEGLYLNELSVDALIFVKVQLEFYQKNKFISDSI